jgi:thiamine biosynthesis protein ThiS
MESLKLNGIERQFTPGQMPATLAELLKNLKIETSAVVAEVDGVIVRAEEFAQMQLKDGQCIELVRFMGGG